MEYTHILHNYTNWSRSYAEIWLKGPGGRVGVGTGGRGMTEAGGCGKM